MCDIALFCYLSMLNAPGGGVPVGHLRTILHEGQRMARVQNGKEILRKVSTPE